MKKRTWAKFMLWWDEYWLWVIIPIGLIICFIVPMWYLGGMKEDVRDYIIGINVASLPWGVLQTLVFVGFLYLLQYGGGFARMKKSKINAENVHVKFKDVVGLDEAKREAWEVVQLIRDRTRVRRIGGKILKGVLMVGPPGCGKTMLAKAIASEAGIPFLSVAGSEFVEIFVGVGASRVRRLFNLARQNALAYGACIIFLDELDVVGRNRVFNSFGGSEETNSTLNQLLVEMDGLNDSEADVIVIGATNAGQQVLDAALLRPGRFDRLINVGRPNLEERAKLFEYYLGKVKAESSIDVPRLARKSVFKTPADIQNIVQEASLIAIRNKHDLVSYKDISAAIERIELGIAHRLSMNAKEKEMVAYHEAGHLVVLYLTHPTDDVFKASIIQRGGTLGVVHHIPREELHLSDRNRLFAHIKTALAGYVAEKMQYGVTTSGVAADFANAMAMADSMVWNLGMGLQGIIGDVDFNEEQRRYKISEALKAKLNQETQDILNLARAEVEQTLKAEWHILERFVKELVVKEELDYDEIAAIFMEYGKQPKILPPAAPVSDMRPPWESGPASEAPKAPAAAPSKPPQAPGPDAKAA